MSKESLTNLTTARYELLTEPLPGLSRGSIDSLLRLLDKRIGYKAPSALYEDLSDIPKTPTPVAPPPVTKSRPSDFLIALCVGHSRAGDSGASSVFGESEHSFYSKFIVPMVADILRAKGFKVIIINSYQGSSYGRAMRWLAGELKRLDVDLAYEFHFNSASARARGFETLFWHKSTVSKPIAQAMQTVQANDYSDKQDRGIEPLGDQAHERGTLFCSLPHCPSIILEPFFGSNRFECQAYMPKEKRQRFGSMLANGIEAGADLLLA